MSGVSARQVERIGHPEPTRPYLAERDRNLSGALSTVPVLLARTLLTTVGSATKTSAAYTEASTVWRMTFTAPMDGAVTVRFVARWSGSLGAAVRDTSTATNLQAVSVQAAGNARRNIEIPVSGLSPGVEYTTTLAYASDGVTSSSVLWGGTDIGICEVWSYPDLSP